MERTSAGSGSGRCRRDDVGAAALEYIAMIAAAGILLAGLFLAVNHDAVDKLANKVCQTFTKITGHGTCSESGETITKSAPDRPCTLSTQEFSATSGATGWIIDADVSGDVQIIQTSDGKYRVIVSGDIAAGVSQATGANIDVGKGGYGTYQGAFAGIGGELKAGNGWEFTFDSADEASAFADRMKNYAGAAEPGGGPGTLWQGTKDGAQFVRNGLPDWGWIPGDKKDNSEVFSPERWPCPTRSRVTCGDVGRVPSRRYPGRSSIPSARLRRSRPPAALVW